MGMECTIDTINRHKAEYYFCGDLNINFLQSDFKLNISNYSDMLISLGCIPLIRHPTRITSSSATLIDHMYSNNLLNILTPFILLIEDISDHFPVILLLNNTKHNSPSNDHIRDTKNFNVEKFQIDLHEKL